ncbi:MAG TPA: sigma-70 family RNA polymerase sigma factor [Lacisediminihabitans sp.]|uniref:RNA polymerase sigma factor n=1 Tax=Lacisediminihabitans sp. TaxID=2787631 RepID=UPI002EDB52D3
MAGSDDSELLQNIDDRIIVGRAADGDPVAFEVLVRRYGPLMRAYAARILNGSEDADDVVQETFITAWQRLPELEDLEAVKGWLMRIVSHKAIDRVRSRKPQVDIAEHERPAPQSRAPERVVEARSQMEALSDAIGKLPEQQRQCWVLREVSGYSYDEIAAELGISNSSVRGLLFRARKYLIVEMEAWR